MMPAAAPTPIPTPPPPPPPHSRWPTYWYLPLSSFSDGAAGTKVTSVGTNPGQWTGTVHNGAVLGPGSEWPASADSAALEFSGGTWKSNRQHVSIDGGVTIGGKGLTLCFNVKFDSFDDWSRIVDFANGPIKSAGNDNIIVFNSGKTSTLSFNIVTGSGAQRSISVDNFWEIGDWVHTCVSVDDLGIMRAFKNGVAIHAGSVGAIPERIHRKQCYIGRSNDLNWYFHGSISDLTIIDGHAVTTE